VSPDPLSMLFFLSYYLLDSREEEAKIYCTTFIILQSADIHTGA
jgi:hypothetical protein